MWISTVKYSVTGLQDSVARLEGHSWFDFKHNGFVQVTTFNRVRGEESIRFLFQYQDFQLGDRYCFTRKCYTIEKEEC